MAIKGQQRKVQAQEREASRDYIDRESHSLWGKRYLLTVVERDAAPSIDRQHSRIVLSVRPGTSTERREALLDAWYREQLKAAVPPLLAKWEALLGVKSSKIFVQRMKTQWGSCNPATCAIRLNTDLAKKPPECLEYIVVHELAHLQSPGSWICRSRRTRAAQANQIANSCGARTMAPVCSAARA